MFKAKTIDIFTGRFWQELKSVSEAAKLLNSITTRIRVLRANEEVELDRKEVVPGDVVVLSSSSSSSLFCYSMLKVD